jgi:hypothetical protein
MTDPTAASAGLRKQLSLSITETLTAAGVKLSGRHKKLTAAEGLGNISERASSGSFFYFFMSPVYFFRLNASITARTMPPINFGSLMV